MNFVKAINEISSQLWAAALLVLGVAAFGLAAVCHPQDVRAALMSSATGMVAAGIAMFQHQPKSAADTK